MSLTSPLIRPINSTERIQSLDVMRGIVLFGILLMNINGMGLAGAYDDPTVAGGATGWDLYTWIATNMLFEGTMRGLFSLLFGVGMFIFLDRLEKKGAGINAANIYFRRITWLLVFGLIHGYLLLWTGEILFEYALMGFLVFSFRNLAPKKLILIAISLLTIGTLWTSVEYKQNKKLVEQVSTAKAEKSNGKELSKELKEAVEEWDKISHNKSAEYVAEQNINRRKGYFDVVAFLAPANRYYDKFYTYRYDVWDILSMMLIGIALYKLDVLSPNKSYRFYIIMALLGYGIGLSVNYYEIRTILDNNFSFLSLSKSLITYDLGRVPLAMGHIGLIMIFCKTPTLTWLKNSLAAVGKMALTNYVMHSIFAIFIFTGVGFGLFGKLHRHELLYIVFSIWILQLIISPIWLKYFQFGPLEWLWRNVSYGKKHPFKIQKAEAN
jgi:uncharacterized protein